MMMKMLKYLLMIVIAGGCVAFFVTNQYFCKLFDVYVLVFIGILGAYVVVETLNVRRTNLIAYVTAYLLLLIFGLYGRNTSDGYGFNLTFYWLNRYASTFFTDIEATVNVCVNLLLFAPIGCVIARLDCNNKLKLVCFAIAMLVFIPLIELLQPLLRVGNFDLSDIVLNWISVVLGYCGVEIINNIAKPLLRKKVDTLTKRTY